MEMRSLGASGPKVSLLGLGTAKIGRNQAMKYPKPFDLPDDAAVVALLEEARRLGVNLIDTAPAYGVAEERLGRLLPRRQDWVLVTKAGEQFENGASRFDFSGPAIRASVEQSLRRLDTDWLDAVLLHSDGLEADPARFYDAVAILDRLKQQGLIRLTGFSGKTVAGGLAMADCVDVLMVTYNAAHTEERPVIEAARAKGRGVLVKKALASGHTDDPAAALRQVAAVPGISSIVVGTLSVRNLAANAAAIGGVP